MNDAEYRVQYVQTVVLDGLLWGRAMCYDTDQRMWVVRTYVIG